MKRSIMYLMSGLISMLMTGQLYAQEIIPLWEQVPHAEEYPEPEIQEKNKVLRIRHIQTPTLEVFLPSPRNSVGMGVIICPGGGYYLLAYDSGGTDLAKFLNGHGIAAFVLKYRLPKPASVTQGYNASLHDAQRALQIVRENAEKWGLEKIGIWGSSAGGHLASTLGTHPDLTFEVHSTEKTSTALDFMILSYPVISMSEEKLETGTRMGLLGTTPTDSLKRVYSSELHVDSNTPPTFLTHAIDDEGVPVEHSLRFLEALKHAGVPAELHVYPQGGHGFSLGLDQPHLRDWTAQLIRWLRLLDE